MLCCCRCFRRRDVYKGPFPDDGERGPIVVKQMIDDGPAPTYSGRPIARLDPIPEASPRPSDDLRDRTAIASGQPVSMPDMEEDPFVSPVQRSTPLLQDAGLLTRAPSRWPTETIAAPTPPPPEPDVVAPLALAMSVPPTPPEPLPTTTAPIKTPSPTPAQPVPPRIALCRLSATARDQPRGLPCEHCRMDKGACRRLASGCRSQTGHHTRSPKHTSRRRARASPATPAAWQAHLSSGRVP